MSIKFSTYTLETEKHASEKHHPDGSQGRYEFTIAKVQTFSVFHDFTTRLRWQGTREELGTANNSPVVDIHEEK